MVLIIQIILVEATTRIVKFPSPCGDYGSYRQHYDYKCIPRNQEVSVPLRGLWFLSAPFINGFMKPLKWHFAGRIIYFHHFLSFARKWFSKNRLNLNFKAAGRNRPACIFKKQVRHINNVCLTNSYYNTSSLKIVVRKGLPLAKSRLWSNLAAGYPTTTVRFGGRSDVPHESCMQPEFMTNGIRS